MKYHDQKQVGGGKDLFHSHFCVAIEPRIISPEVAQPTIYWALPLQSLRKCSTDLPAAQSYGAIFSINVPFLKVTLACVKVA